MKLFSVDDCEYIKKIYFDYDEVDSHQHHDFGVVSIRFRKENSAKFVVIEDKKICNFVFEKVKNFIPNLKQVTNLKVMKYDEGDSFVGAADCGQVRWYVGGSAKWIRKFGDSEIRRFGKEDLELGTRN